MKTFTHTSAKGSRPELSDGPAHWVASLTGLGKILPAAGAIFVLAACAVWATAAAALPLDDDDAPDVAQTGSDSRAVRLSTVEGQVRVIQDGQVIADPAYANLPLFEGAEVNTGNDGRAEVQLEDGSLVRLSPNSMLTFTVLQQQGTGSRTEVVLNNGLAYFELQPSNEEHSLRVSYGPASFSASSFSVVRLTLDTPPGEMALFSGNVHLDRGDSMQLDMHGGESLTLDANDQTRYNLAESIEPDSWDSWNADRDQVLNQEAGEKTAASSGYVNSQGVGMGDLDANGNWYDVPGQGYVWSPFDAQAAGASWDPYGYGRWVNYPGYGFIWNSGYDWGYAPFQCGLWNYYDNFGWGWAPGGGCSPWWYGTGWGYNIGTGPRGYLPPRRPGGGGPGHPHPVGSRTLVAANVIPVDRRTVKTVNMAQYARPAQPVMIGGHTVAPLRPVAPRPGYDRGAAFANRESGREAGGYYPSPTRPAATYMHPGQSGYSGTRMSSMPASHAQSFSSSSSSASHSSYSGGGGMSGGGGHVGGSSGGGGGGGGGSHK
ncbi:FecR family protein [Acidicapsa acidisoli]|uniref:FecR family protein n=1 Tax=Acidicapsa acidisoli TaxID=1615681 RepID=UPI0021DF72A8|nr:FecR family protein [Acidicapsa acidisoli]